MKDLVLVNDYPKILLKSILMIIFSPLITLVIIGFILYFCLGITVIWIFDIPSKKWVWKENEKEVEAKHL